MLDTLSLLGQVRSFSSDVDLIKNVVDKTNAKEVFVIKLNDDCVYEEIVVEDNRGEEKYLYKREKGGLPGKFFTGRIGALDVKNLKRNLIVLSSNDAEKIKKPAQDMVEKFKKNKVSWIKKSGILRNKNLISKIPLQSQKLLSGIVNEIITKQDKIMHEISEKILNGNYGEILLTVKIGSKYLQDIEGFANLLRVAAQGEESLTIEDTSKKNSNCIICGNVGTRDLLREPLPFFTIDKPNFIPGGLRNNSYKVFSLCRICYNNVQNGSRYIQNHLSFDIPNTRGGSRLWLWIIPKLNDPSLVKEYLTHPEKGLGSFKDMLKISWQLDMAQEIDVSEINPHENNDDDDLFIDNPSTESPNQEFFSENLLFNLLTYTTIFHYFDKQKHMRLVGSVDGIYTSRFKELSDTKLLVDKISIATNNQFRFHFGLLTDFLEKDSDGWMKTMTFIMSCMFTKRKMDELLIIKILLAKIKNVFANRQIHEWHPIVLKATVILEYVYRLKLIDPSFNSISDQNPQNIENKDNNSKADINSGFSNSFDKIGKVSKFLDMHSGILYSNNLRAICAIGISVGVILKIQKNYLGSDPFISRLNRLEMDYPRLLGLFPQSFIKLKHYNALDNYEGLFSYLGNNEISNLNPGDEVPKELMNLVFSIGMSHGIMLESKDARK